MAVAAAVLKRTAVSVGLGLALGCPKGTLFFVIVINVYLPPEVLPVVGIHAEVPSVRVVLVAVGAPHSLEMEQVEVCIALHLVQVVDRQLLFVVSESAHIAKAAGVQVVGVGLAKL